LGIRTRLFVVSLALVALALTGAQLFLAPRLETLLTDRIREDLVVRLQLCEEAVSARGAGDGSALAHELGTRAAARVTLIDGSGTVLGDSEVPAERIGSLDNHGSRPEIREAWARGRGESVRYSETLHERMMYLAIPFKRDGQAAGVVRLAFPLTEVDQAVGKLERLLVTAALIMLAVGAVLSSAAAHWTSQSLRRLTRAALAMVGGDLSVRTRVAGHDEVASLSRALDELAQSLSHSLGALRAERDLRDRILMGMREGVLLLDSEDRVLLVNPALREILLLRPDAAGQPLLEAIRHSQLKELLDRANLNPGEVSEEIEVQGLRPRRLLVHAARLGGDSPGLLAVFFDVTDLRRLETLRRDFVANASHELRTPIAAMRSAAETLSDAIRRDPAAAASFVEIIERNSERLHSLVDDLLDLSRIESRELHLAAEPVPVRAAVDHVVSFFEERAKKRSLRLSIEVPRDLPPALADGRALEQVLTNLVDNAVKYCVEGATITLRAIAEESRVVISVEDTGPGIESRHLPRLFERFYRVDASRSRELGGTGLGLSIVKHLVEAMRGTVSVDSAPGRGTRFSFTLPRG
jgi:two-component system phosphate regulon sensor histidine kinase PhoR